MATHTKYTLGGSGVSKVLNLALAVAAAEAGSAEGLIPGKDGKVFNLVTASTAAIGAVVTYKGTIPQQEKVGIRVEEGSARVASKAVQMPAISRCDQISPRQRHQHDESKISSGRDAVGHEGRG